jgi:hypothetical protein
MILVVHHWPRWVLAGASSIQVPRSFGMSSYAISGRVLTLEYIGEVVSKLQF